MPNRQDLEFVADILARAVERGSDQERIERSTALRARIHQAAARGDQVEHYRVQWLATSAGRIIDFAKKLCREFDKDHPEDLATALDLLDILVAAEAHVRSQVTPKKSE